MPVKFAKKIAPAMVTVFFAFIPSMMCAQPAQTTPSSANRASEAFSRAENKWRLAPVDFQSQRDGVEPSVRVARNAYWQPILQREREREADGKSTALTGGPPSLIEIADSPDSVWVVATFDHYLVESIDASFKLLYTEMSFKIGEVIKQPKALFSPGMFFDVDVEGGSLRSPQGDIISWHIPPRRYFVQHGHTYIMQIRPLEAGQFYFIGKVWDVSNGRVVPDHNDEVLRSAQGHSKLNGMTTENAVSYLRSVLASGPSK